MSKVKEKPISEWLEQLPEPIRTKALCNFKKERTKNVKINSLDSAISDAFTWKNTPEGFSYWLSVFKKEYSIEKDFISEDFILLFDSLVNNTMHESIRRHKHAWKLFTFDKKQGWILRKKISPVSRLHP